MIKTKVLEFGNFIENCAKSPSFLKDFDRATVYIEETCGAKVFESNVIWTNKSEEML